MEQLTVLVSIFVINLMLSGDNAVVIALASRSLPPKQQKLTILLGSSGAIVLRIILTILIVFLLKIPLLQAVGGLLLVYIALKLLRDEESPDDLKSAGSLIEAVKIIIVADLIMSLDNTLAIAAISKGDWMMLIIGLVTSIPIVIFCSQIVLFLMKKFPIIVYIGAGVLGWTAGAMVLEDKIISGFLSKNMGGMTELLGWTVPAAVTALVLIWGWLANTRSGGREKAAAKSEG